MGTVEEKAVKHEERPATHNKRAQTYMLAMAIFIVVLFAVSAYSRMQGEQPTLFSASDDAAPRVQRSPPKATLAAFGDQVKAARRKLERLAAKPSQDQESEVVTDDEIWRPRAQPQDEPQDQEGVEWPEDYPPAKPATDRLADKERNMVEQSRTTPIEVSLGFTKKTRTPRRSIQASSARGKIGALEQEIQRVQALRANLQQPGASGGPTPGLASLATVSSLASGGEPSALSVGRPSPPTPSAPVVGQAASSPTPRLPGQQLLPLTTVIQAVLDQQAISDYEGPMRLLVVQDVYDVAKAHVLIPKGSKVLARSLVVGNVNAAIQSRMGIAVQSVVLPNGTAIDFSRQAALDREGVAAIEGDTDYHLIEQFLGVAAFALISTGTSRSGSGANSDTTFQGELGQAARQQFSPLLQRYLQLVPTITLEAGTPMRIFLQEALYIFPWSTVGERYVSTH